MMKTSGSEMVNNTKPYLEVDDTLPAKGIVQSVMQADQNTLLIPPKFQELQLGIETPVKDEVEIGLFSSGSTGAPKCIWNTRQNLLLNGELSRETFGLTLDDRVLILASPWHVAGLTWALMAELASVDYKMVVPHVQESEKWGELINKYKPTFIFTVPTVLRYLVQQDHWSCDNIAYGGAPIEPEMYAQLRPFTRTLYQAYGQTEAGGLIAAHIHDMAKEPYEWEAICCGKSPEGIILECNSSDFDDPAPIRLLSKTAVFDDWYETGDYGFINSEGNVHITGRKEQKHGNCNMISSVTSIAHK
jgi:acyl-coenzyme A synthetase/AMP-(fatty) acid ligase